MSFRPHLRLAAIAARSTIAFGAHAADVQVSCEKRINRSKMSIEGNNLASGSYRAFAKSGTRTATSDCASTGGDEVEFDFDSRAGDIAEGATAIAASFIVDGRVKGYLVNASGARVKPAVTTVCRVRS